MTHIQSASGVGGSSELHVSICEKKVRRRARPDFSSNHRVAVADHWVIQPTGVFDLNVCTSCVVHLMFTIA